MKLNSLCLLIIISISLFAKTYQVKSLKSHLENSLLYNMWRDVPGASTKKDSPQYLQSSVSPSINSASAGVISEGWLSISSTIFKDETKFPVLRHPDGFADILTSSDYTRINEKYKDLPLNSKSSVQPKQTNPNEPPGRTFFYFRLNQKYLYFAEDNKCINVLGSVDLTKVVAASVHFLDEKCFTLQQKSGTIYKLCGVDHESTKKFVCQIQSNLRAQPDEYCLGKKPADPAVVQPQSSNGGIVEKVITQPYILIPLAREMCNENWTYDGNWDCLCKEGKA